MSLQKLDTDIVVMLNAFMVSSKRVNILKKTAVVFSIESFGTIVCGIDRIDYLQVHEVLTDNFPGWRMVYITNQEDINKKRYDVLWGLMRGGYMKWLRLNFPRNAKSVLLGQDNLGTRILQERLNIWSKQPKYKYLLEDTKSVLRHGITVELTHDPGFLDYMPEELG